MKPPSAALLAAMRASLARIEAKAAEFMVEHDDVSVDGCLCAAVAYEVMLYGALGDEDVTPVAGESPIESLIRRFGL